MLIPEGTCLSPRRLTRLRSRMCSCAAGQEWLGTHTDTAFGDYSGSVTTGRTIMKAAALSNLKKVTLELGGKSPNIIFGSADLDQAAAWSAMGGQSS